MRNWTICHFSVLIYQTTEHKIKKWQTDRETNRNRQRGREGERGGGGQREREIERERERGRRLREKVGEVGNETEQMCKLPVMPDIV